MAQSILLSPDDVAGVYINKEKCNLSAWFYTLGAKDVRKPCDYIDEDNSTNDKPCYKFENVDIAFRDIKEINEMVAKCLEYSSVKLVPREFLQCDKGGFFEEHSDKQHCKTHIGNAMLIPPSNILKYSGGTLVADGKRFTASPNKWRLVILPIDTKHKITKVTDGTRVVIKFQIRGVKFSSERRIKKNSKDRKEEAVTEN